MKDALDIAVAETNQRMAEKVLGVLCRGTDYVSLRPYNHPVQPSVSEMLQKAGEMLRCYKLEHIYLVTEDEGIRRAFEVLETGYSQHKNSIMRLFRKSF